LGKSLREKSCFFGTTFNKHSMSKYSDYNIIPIGDHCVISIILSELNLRKHSYPFDWVTHTNQLYDSNIMYNVQIINDLKSSDNIDHIVHQYIGDAFNNNYNNNTNSINHIWFPHDHNLSDSFIKYKRRFIRLKSHLNQKNIFIIVTRHLFIPLHVFLHLIHSLLHNNDSIILFISGTNHSYFHSLHFPNVFFKFIHYDIYHFFRFDYSSFRPNIKLFLSSFFFS